MDFRAFVAKYHTWPYHASVFWYTEATFSFQMQQQKFQWPYLRNDTIDFHFLNDGNLDKCLSKKDPSHLHPHFSCQARIEPNVWPTLTHFEVPRNGVQKRLHSYAGAPITRVYLDLGISQSVDIFARAPLQTMLCSGSGHELPRPSLKVVLRLDGLTEEEWSWAKTVQITVGVWPVLAVKPEQTSSPDYHCSVCQTKRKNRESCLWASGNIFQLQAAAMGAMRNASWCSKFNRSHSGLPPMLYAQNDWSGW